jgi:hypothetical protein
MRFGLIILLLIIVPSVSPGDVSFFQPSARSPRLGEIIYFLLPDRFNDGDPSNNSGRSASADPNESGFDPANPDFFHGGDLEGVTAKLDYLHDLGATSIWMSPIFRNRAVHRKRVSMVIGFWTLRMLILISEQRRIFAV